jgi:hypothetical protein
MDSSRDSKMWSVTANLVIRAACVTRAESERRECVLDLAPKDVTGWG